MKAIFRFGVVVIAAALPAQWRQLAVPTSPTARHSPAMACDFGGNTFLFGGRTFVPNAQVSNETWRFDGTAWNQLGPANWPAARYGASLVFDSVRGVFVLFGGSRSVLPVGESDTWEFDGQAWTQVLPSMAPNAVVNHGSCFDSVRNRVVVYGGMLDMLTTSASTCEYDGVNWQQVTMPTGPGPLHSMAMCFHAGIGKTVLFGGRGGVTGTDTTWLFDGVTWTAVPAPGPRPAPRLGARMVYDLVRGVCVLTGGADDATSVPLVDTWEFDGTSWQQQNTTITASGVFGLAFDVAHQNIVRFGGYTNPPYSLINETWLYGAATRSFGNGCAGSAGTPVLQALTPPNLGLTYHLQLSNLVPATPIAAVAVGFTELPGVPLATIGMPGCSAFVTPDVLVTVPAGGTAGWMASVPSLPALLGLSLFTQGLSLDPGANTAGVTVSNAVEGLIGH
jgi:hypothetical protein